MAMDCAVCGKRVFKGRPKMIKNQEEVEQHFYNCRKPLVLGDVLYYAIVAGGLEGWMKRVTPAKEVTTAIGTLMKLRT